MFGLYIPIYSFWHFDDFSWGNTRVVIDPSGKPKTEDSLANVPFDPSCIPLKLWSDYQSSRNELIDTQSTMSINSGSTQKVALENMRGSSFQNTPATEKEIMPSDHMILTEIRHILSTSDLMTVTKKTVRDKLSRFFGVDLTVKRDFINKAIEDILKGE